LSQGDREKSAQTLQDIYNQYKNLQIPDVDKQKLALQMYQSQGTLQPQAEQTVQLSPQDAYQNISTDPRLAQAQMQQLDTLSKLGQTSFTPAEKAQLDTMRRQGDADTTSRLQQLLQQQDQRGVGSSDAALAMRLSAAQSGANKQSEQADSLAAMAQQRALAAMTGAGSLATSLRGQDYSEQQNLANALNQRDKVMLNYKLKHSNVILIVSIKLKLKFS